MDALSKAGFSTEMFYFYELVNLYSLALWVVPIFGVMSVPASIGLFFMKIWGRYLGIILGIVSIILAVTLFLFGPYRFSLLLTMIFLVFGVVLIVYLFGDLKYEF